MRGSDNFCDYVDVFYGNGEVDHFAEDGPASKWFYIKAISGNTVPHATLPFGRMSVGPYSGGYPCGYGTHYPNCSGGIQKLSEVQTVRGFSHLHHSGVGGISYYFNYAITTPFYGDIAQIERFYELKDEKARPGYYSARMNGIFCEVTVDGATALHRYRFAHDGGRLAIDFSNDGLHKLFPRWYRGVVRDASLRRAGKKVFFSAVMSGIRLYFCAEFAGENLRTALFDGERMLSGDEAAAGELTEKFGVTADFDGREIALRLSYSTLSFEAAERNVTGAALSFEETAERARDIWNGYLSAIEIETGDEELKRRFYSNLYHSLVKPNDLTGEEVFGVKGEVVTGIATFWDQYKTLFPLIFTLYPEMGEKLVRGLLNISRTQGKVSCLFDLSEVMTCEEQSKMLAGYALCDAYHSGIPGAEPEEIDAYIRRELAREDFKEFLAQGTFERYTHITDATDLCRNAAAITRDAGFREELLRLAGHWSKAFDGDGLMSQKSAYYEGDRYTYSFRLLANMEERIALAGGRERFVGLLDAFFGFGRESVKQLTYIGAGKEIDRAQHHRFEGFNNECDMETPYAYIYAGRNDRTCEIVHAAVTQSYLSGRGGLPGNNDSGGLSSCYIWNVLGLFPAAGQGEFLLGSPHIDRATLRLSSGRRLEIEVDRSAGDGYITGSAEWNGRPLESFRIRTSELMQGGRLTFRMKGQG